MYNGKIYRPSSRSWLRTLNVSLIGMVGNILVLGVVALIGSPQDGRTFALNYFAVSVSVTLLVSLCGPFSVMLEHAMGYSSIRQHSGTFILVDPRSRKILNPDGEELSKELFDERVALARRP